MPAPTFSSAEPSWLGRAWSVVSDLLIATALMWTIPLLLAAAAAIVRLLLPGE